METTTTTKKSLTRKITQSKSSSFRLRSPSLNTVRLRRTFDLFDKNADGFITVDELSQALQMLGLDTDVSEINSLVDSHIKPGNIGLEFEDFKSLHVSLNEAFFGLNEVVDGKQVEEEDLKMRKQQEEESDLSEAFKVFDENGDGYISAQELQTVLKKLGLVEEGKEIHLVEQMILSVDTNCDGRVDFFEFKDMMRSVLVHIA